MKEDKQVQFWEAQKELRKLLLPIGAQLALTQQVLRAQMPQVQEAFEQVKQLGGELGFHVDESCLKPLYDYSGINTPLHANDLYQNDMEAEKGQQE